MINRKTFCKSGPRHTSTPQPHQRTALQNAAWCQTTLLNNRCHMAPNMVPNRCPVDDTLSGATWHEKSSVVWCDHNHSSLLFSCCDTTLYMPKCSVVSVYWCAWSLVSVINVFSAFTARRYAMLAETCGHLWATITISIYSTHSTLFVRRHQRCGLSLPLQLVVIFAIFELSFVQHEANVEK